MQRDFELIRKIMTEIAAEVPAGSTHFSFTMPGEYEDKVVWAHIELLIEAGLIEGSVQRSMDMGLRGVNLRGLTWAGYDFLEAASKDTLWKKAFATVKEKGGAMTFDVLKALLKTYAMSAAGLS
jgi:hypothetical protein